MPRTFVIAVGALYVLFAAWCTIQPQRTAEAIGFRVQPGSGESEYMVVYGGLQLALGLMLLAPTWRAELTQVALQACIILHGCLVLFRLLSLVRYSGITQPTYYLAGLEGLILVLALVVWRWPGR
jgi:hypothetical protein